jgi:hypothetical protein
MSFNISSMPPSFTNVSTSGHFAVFSYFALKNEKNVGES